MTRTSASRRGCPASSEGRDDRDRTRPAIAACRRQFRRRARDRDRHAPWSGRGRCERGRQIRASGLYSEQGFVGGDPAGAITGQTHRRRRTARPARNSRSGHDAASFGLELRMQAQRRIGAARDDETHHRPRSMTVAAVRITRFEGGLRPAQDEAVARHRRRGERPGLQAADVIVDRVRRQPGPVDRALRFRDFGASVARAWSCGVSIAVPAARASTTGSKERRAELGQNGSPCRRWWRLAESGTRRIENVGPASSS